MYIIVNYTGSMQRLEHIKSNKFLLICIHSKLFNFQLFWILNHIAHEEIRIDMQKFEQTRI